MADLTEQTARLMHIERDDDMHSLIKTVLSMHGVHEPIEHVSFRTDAYHVLRDIATNTHATPDVIIINPNLSEQFGNADGRIVTKLIRRLGIASKIAVLYPEDRADPTLDFDFSFKQSRIEELARYIKKLRA